MSVSTKKNDLKTLSMREQLGGQKNGRRTKELPDEVKEVISMNKYCHYSPSFLVMRNLRSHRNTAPPNERWQRTHKVFDC